MTQVTQQQLYRLLKDLAEVKGLKNDIRQVKASARTIERAVVRHITFVDLPTKEDR
jgi:hypothetical protein